MSSDRRDCDCFAARFLMAFSIPAPVPRGKGQLWGPRDAFLTDPPSPSPPPEYRRREKIAIASRTYPPGAPRSRRLLIAGQFDPTFGDNGLAASTCSQAPAQQSRDPGRRQDRRLRRSRWAITTVGIRLGSINRDGSADRTFANRVRLRQISEILSPPTQWPCKPMGRSSRSGFGRSQ